MKTTKMYYIETWDGAYHVYKSKKGKRPKKVVVRFNTEEKLKEWAAINTVILERIA